MTKKYLIVYNIKEPNGSESVIFINMEFDDNVDINVVKDSVAEKVVYSGIWDDGTYYAPECIYKATIEREDD